MSRILRRPMFRGGRVDSRGTGITSGLMDDTGYADGGRVGFQIGGGLFSSGPYNPYSANNIFSGTSLGYNPIFNIPTSSKPSLSDLAGPGPQEIIPRSRIPGLPPIKDTSTYKQEYIDIFGKTPTARDLMNYAASKDKYQESTEEVNKFLELEAKKPIKQEGIGTGVGVGTGAGKDDIDLLDLDEEKIKRESKLYEKLLGGEEARAQAGFDVLLAAAPAFFKGKNLREAAPQVLESINKSGAFDKPRDIKQAAAQLAIQRRIAVETAKAKSDDQLTRLEKQLSAKDTVLNKLSRIPGIQRGDYAGNLPRIPAPDEYSSLAPDKYFSVGNELYVTIGETVKDPKSGKLVKKTVKFSPLG